MRVRPICAFGGLRTGPARNGYRVSQTYTVCVHGLVYGYTCINRVRITLSIRVRLVLRLEFE